MVETVFQLYLSPRFLYSKSQYMVMVCLVKGVVIGVLIIVILVMLVPLLQSILLLNEYPSDDKIIVGGRSASIGEISNMDKLGIAITFYKFRLKNFAYRPKHVTDGKVCV